MSSNPKIFKAQKLKGKTLAFRDVTVDDANFIFSLRMDSKKGRHLSQTSPDIRDQITWIENYANNDGEAYFIIENSEGLALGTIRIYDAQGDSFCWGSWILKDNAPISTAIESTLMMYSYAFEHLKFKKAHLDIRKDNHKVRKFHEFCGAWYVGETELDDLYEYNIEKFIELKKKTDMYLTESVVVER